MTRVLFVCLGNICRSPLGEGIFRSLVEQRGLADRFEIDSAGTGDWHVGEPPDPRSIAIAAHHGIDIRGQRARQVSGDDFAHFDLVLAMDRANERDLLARCPAEQHPRVRRLREYDPQSGHDVPDPWFGTHGFDLVFAMVERCCTRLLDELHPESSR
ncbi:MAG: low molecular weight phosphotyrosine protein phosphatase [Planctomycetes bacterium]|nr:low molecular weight phosphotyrosine protein phosphatase [Planctomycetota bacterium]MCC7170484.1 low molecular weight phosphotyrosine protein phosphatase [Planctomycetota bacterium]